MTRMEHWWRWTLTDLSFNMVVLLGEFPSRLEDRVSYCYHQIKRLAHEVEVGRNGIPKLGMRFSVTYPIFF